VPPTTCGTPAPGVRNWPPRRRLRRLDADTPDGGVPRPEVWGGYRVVPDRVEFWQGGTDRLHDRLRFVRDDDEGGGWIVQRLAP
jgi:pyridoxamine 5'-phosphate oxidase